MNHKCIFSNTHLRRIKRSSQYIPIHFEGHSFLVVSDGEAILSYVE